MEVWGGGVGGGWRGREESNCNVIFLVHTFNSVQPSELFNLPKLQCGH